MVIKPDLEPSWELSYLLGVRYGDMSLSGRTHEVQLGVKDKDFAEEFARCLSQVNGRTYKVHQPPSAEGRYVVQAGSRILVDYLSLEFELQKSIIEYYPEAFIRGFADSEGGVAMRDLKPHYIEFTNTNTEILEYVKELLSKYFGIYSSITEIDKSRPAGTIMHYMRGLPVIKRKRQYALRIYRNKDKNIFTEKIGFSIKRKAEKLEVELSA